jgi:hypothetical protein
MKWSNWGDDDTSPQEKRATQPDEGRHRASSGRYKDKKHWCRGKIGGRRHTGEIRLERSSYKSDDTPDCYHSHFGRLEYYSCSHKLVCSNPQCRKVVKWRLEEDCPDYGKIFWDGRTRVAVPMKERKP